MWDPDRYLTFAAQRGRPFDDLVAQVGADDPTEVVDLGCGPGNLTATMTQRWPRAHITGVDSSAAMIEKASARPGIDWVEADLRTWQPGRSVDVLVSNATFQWVPGHLSDLPRLTDVLTAGGWFAFQVPGNFGEPSHVLLREEMAAPRWRDRFTDVTLPASHDPVEYLDALATAGLIAIDVWETTYFHVLTGDDPVLSWVSGTALRPVLATLDQAEQAEFLEPYGAALREAYPQREDGSVILPYRRVFAVARKP